jgi:hypothetical protein
MLKKFSYNRDRIQSNEFVVSVYKSGKISNAISVGKVKPAPSILSLRDNFEETAAFINEMILDGRTRFENKDSISDYMRQRQIALECPIVSDYYDFSTIKSITIGVALILASIFDTHLKTGARIDGAVNFELWDERVKLILRHTGFMNITNVDVDGVIVSGSSDIRILRFKSGSEADGEEVSELLSRLGVAEIMNFPELYDALIEALVNVRQHAYPNSYIFDPPHFRGWWITGLVRHTTKEIKLIAYDSGVGIPYSIRNSQPNQQFERVWRKTFPSKTYLPNNSLDGHLIEKAMQPGA